MTTARCFQQDALNETRAFLSEEETEELHAVLDELIELQREQDPDNEASEADKSKELAELAFLAGRASILIELGDSPTPSSPVYMTDSQKTHVIQLLLPLLGE